MTVPREIEQPLSQRVYEEIRRRIILGEYAQGSVLSDQRLAEELDVSRIPVREALPSLHAEGLLRIRPRRSSLVAEWSRQGVEDLFAVRLAIEVAAAGAAARRVQQGFSLDELIAAVEEAEARLALQSDPLVQAESNCQIHLTLVAAAGNALMDDVMRSLSGRMTWLFYLTSARDLSVQSHEHHKILQAVAAGNDHLAEALTHAHIEEGRGPSLDVIGL